ncbi:hypothetical protein D4100_16755 [Serratia inhibens]|uniref:Uncharacterized protein n=1 Tax=Serratia inhibens TaxID=2338073 RepID=A0AA92X3W5_9GAMM|nr:hypothetical protein D4100_16755 [Serratia inhibens]
MMTPISRTCICDEGTDDFFMQLNRTCMAFGGSTPGADPISPRFRCAPARYEWSKTSSLRWLAGVGNVFRCAD